jgi:1-deoxy-D-xylulose-5-phosphate synthase
VGADGATHAGSYDIAYLSNLPGFVVMAASDEAELVHMVRTALEIDDRPAPSATRAARAWAWRCRSAAIALEIGKGRIKSFTLNFHWISCPRGRVFIRFGNNRIAVSPI